MPRPFAPTHPTPLIISDGGVESALAAAHAAEAHASDQHDETSQAPAPVLWPAACESAAPDQACEQATKRLAERLGLRTVRAPRPGPLKQREGTPREAETLLLVRACTLAAELGLPRVVWPARRDDLDDSARAHDRALLIARVAGLDAEAVGAPELRIDAPYLDLSDEQVAELVEDIGAPIESCWWADADPQDDPASADEHRRWGWLLARLSSRTVSPAPRPFSGSGLEGSGREVSGV